MFYILLFWVRLGLNDSIQSIMPNIEFEQALLYYKSQHRTKGCILTHLFGVPLVALSFPLMLINLRRGLTLFGFAWALQFIGHFYFEKNKPVLLTPARTYLLPLAALVTVFRHWRDIFAGEFMLEDKNGHVKEPSGNLLR